MSVTNASGYGPPGTLPGDPGSRYQRIDGPPYFYRKFTAGWVAADSMSDDGSIAWTSVPVVVAGGNNGLMSGTDKTKLDGIAASANNYVHPNHSGDVTSVGDGAQTIAANAVTNAKAAQMATKTYKGRTSAGTGNPEDVAVATLKTDLGLVKADVGLGSVDNTADTAKPVSTAQQTALNLKADLAGAAFTGAVTSSGTAGMGYNTGAGGVVTQSTSKSTGVTLNKVCGEITLNAAALAAGAIVSFTLTNSTIGAKDVLIINHASGGTGGAYTVNAQCAAGSAVINVRNNTAGSLSEAIVLRYVLIKAVTS